MSPIADEVGAGAVWHSHVGIPVRNLWMLLVYASDLAGFREAFDAQVDDEAEIADVLARLLVFVVERRLRRSLSRGYEDRRNALSRVRGRIDWLETEAGMLLRRGLIACRYQDLTHDTPRNRLVRVALETAASRVRDRGVSRDCSRISRLLEQAGVTKGEPSRAEMSRDQIARHDADDRLMVTAARLVLDLVLPSEIAGQEATTRLQRDEVFLRKIFEKAVAGLYRHELHGRDGWSIHPQKTLHWPAAFLTSGMEGRLPTMAADVVLQRGVRHIVLETKFTNALSAHPHGGHRFKSSHIYQLYAYLRSQSGTESSAAENSEGIILYPAVDEVLDESVTIQGHKLRFVTVDLSVPSAALRDAILDVVRVS